MVLCRCFLAAFVVLVVLRTNIEPFTTSLMFLFFSYIVLIHHYPMLDDGWVLRNMFNLDTSFMNLSQVRSLSLFIMSLIWIKIRQWRNSAEFVRNSMFSTFFQDFASGFNIFTTVYFSCGKTSSYSVKSNRKKVKFNI